MKAYLEAPFRRLAAIASRDACEAKRRHAVRRETLEVFRLRRFRD